jgi:hypothetical protein
MVDKHHSLLLWQNYKSLILTMTTKKTLEEGKEEWLLNIWTMKDNSTRLWMEAIGSKSSLTCDDQRFIWFYLDLIKQPDIYFLRN